MDNSDLSRPSNPPKKSGAYPRTTLPWMLTNAEKVKFGTATTSSTNLSEVTPSNETPVDVDWKKLGDQTVAALNIAAKVILNASRKARAVVKKQLENLQGEKSSGTSAQSEGDSLTYTNYDEGFSFQDPKPPKPKKQTEVLQSEVSRVEVKPEIAQSKQYEPDIENIPAPIKVKKEMKVRPPKVKVKRKSVNYRGAVRALIAFILLGTIGIGGFYAYPKLNPSKTSTTITSTQTSTTEEILPTTECPVKSRDFSIESIGYKICYATRDFRPNLTDQQILQVINAIETSFKNCISQKVAAPVGCPIRETEYTKVQSIRWIQVQTTKPIFTSQDANFVYATVQYAASAKGVYLRNGKRTTFNYPEGNEKPVKVETKEGTFQVSWI